MKTTNVFFTSDHHFSHGNIIKYASRLEFCNEKELKIMTHGTAEEKLDLRMSQETVDRMDNHLIKCWNSVVPSNGTVFFLGDFFLTGDKEKLLKLRNNLNGTIYAIKGNHDKQAYSIKDTFQWWGDYLEMEFEEPNSTTQLICMMHYSLNVWNKMHRGSWHLYGHSHGTLPINLHSKSFDVGVDSVGYYPFSYEQVKKVMDTRESPSFNLHNGSWKEVTKYRIEV